MRLAALAFGLALSTQAVAAAESAPVSDDVAALKALVKQLSERVATLEQRNLDTDQSLASDRISEQEPELVTRLKAVESQSLAMQKSSRTVEALDGLSAGLSLTSVAQQPSAAVHRPGADINGKFGASQLNYRGDAVVTLPLDDIGNTESRVFAHVRFGQGNGLNDFYAFSKPNGTAFRVLSTAPDDAVAVLGEAWYQATIPLPFDGFKPRSTEAVEVNFGKMDPFGFFDQNKVANDETRQFLNTAFVHNLLLDAGGDIGVDANGFSPGVRLAYVNRTDKSEPWRLSAGLFGAGQGANYTRAFSSPLVIAQAEVQLRFAGGLLGNYRLYYWRNGQAPTFAGGTSVHSGVGISIDQRIDESITAFLRYGRHLSGTGSRFDQALTTGVELSGDNWSRGADSVGLGVGLIPVSNAFHTASLTVDANGNGVPDYGFTASGTERLAEMYYRWRLGKQFELSPDLQVIRTPAGNNLTSTFRTVALRAQISY